MFVGRDAELEQLNNIYDEGKFECIFIYGRRRVGKTALIKEFVKDKRSISFIATESSESDNLKAFSSEVLKFQGVDGGSFGSFDELMLSLTKIKERAVLVIDEYPYLAESFKGMSSLLQKYIDTYFKDSKLFIILCGSSMSFMESETAYKKPLYGRKTGQIKLEPFTFFEARKMLKSYNLEDQVLAYSVTGGVPYYLSLLDTSKSIRENITKLFFNPLGALFEEPQNLLKQELREPKIFNSIIKAIADGASKNNEIGGKVGAQVSNYLTQLIKLGIVKKETPLMAETNKKTIYLLQDSMFVFWYKFVDANRLPIVWGAGDKVYDMVQPEFSTFLGHCFETICKDWLKIKNANLELPFMFTELGKWWGGNPITKSEEEIDIVARGNKQLILAECKYTNEQVGVVELNDLLLQGELFKNYEKHYYIFSKTGFKKSCFEAKTDNIHLIDLWQLAE